MNIQKYMAFVKTVESGSFTKAALALNYTQSGISRMIKDLETEWGVSLLERNRAGVSVERHNNIPKIQPKIPRMYA